MLKVLEYTSSQLLEQVSHRKLRNSDSKTLESDRNRRYSIVGLLEHHSRTVGFTGLRVAAYATVAAATLHPKLYILGVTHSGT